MRQISLQQELYTGAGEFVATVHGRGSKNRIYLAQIQQNVQPGSPTFNQRGCRLPDAIAQAQAWEGLEAADCYLGANGFTWQPGTGRTVSSVTAITGIYVDFDRYNIPQYASLSCEDFLTAVLTENPWLPVPSVFVDSGKGCWAFWLFKRPLPTQGKYDFLPQWQQLIDYMVSKLARYGADPSCADAARVVRMPGTINTKTGETAKAWTIRSHYEFKELKSAITAEFRRDRARQKPAIKVPHMAPAKQKVSSIRNPHTLARSRMYDLKTLARLRGGKFKDFRKRAAFIYAVEAAHFCRNKETIQSEVRAFITEHFENPDKYLSQVNYEAVLARFEAEQRLIESKLSRQAAREQLGRSQSQYMLSNRYIINVLDISPAEQRKLKSIISKEEKRDRKTMRRREAGCIPRAEYLQQVEQRRQQARCLYQAKHSIRTLSKLMGLPLSTVHNYLKG